MEFIKEEIEDMSDPEPSRIKHEDTEEQIDQVRVKEQRQELNEVKEEQRNFTIQRSKAKKTHTCTQCGKSFSHLKTHLIVHSDERPYVCFLCGKSFSRLYSLKQHQKTHNEVRDYMCFDCGKSFTRAENLKKHQRIHT
ncbi:hypothetical protein PO909_003632 [Leuciscus waleckii]